MHEPTHESYSLIRDSSYGEGPAGTVAEEPLETHLYDRTLENRSHSFEIDDDHDPSLDPYIDTPIRHDSFLGSHSTTSDPDLFPPPLPEMTSFRGGFFSRLLARISQGMDGPVKLREPHVTPVFRKLQYLPNELADRWPSPIKKAAVATFVGLWTLLFYVIAQHSILEIPLVDGSPVDILTCGTTYDIWLGKNERCGLNGTRCSAMEPGIKDMMFKCPAGCREDSYTWSYTPVGDYESIYRPYVIGGDNNLYRPDSYVCASLIHHGYMSNNVGRCGRITFQGPQNTFEGSKGKSGIESLTFSSWFPQSFSVDDDFAQNHSSSGCRDLRFLIVWLNISLSVVFAYFMTNGLVFFWVMMVLGFWTVALGSNPPWTYDSIMTSEEAVSELVSASFRRFLPFMLGTYVVWRASGRGLLLGLKEHLSKAIFWVAGFWVAVLENYTFNNLPINRLIISDIKQQKGGFLALIIIVGIILSAAFGQAYIIWRLGKFKKYISIYLLMILGLVVLATIPNQTLRLHHYILGLVLLPGVGFKTTPGLLYQGLLSGLYVSGIARWDFDSIVQTALQLNRGDALNIGGLPELLEPVIGNFSSIASNVTLEWADLGQTAIEESVTGQHGWNGFSLIINDIEYYRGAATSFDLTRWIVEFGAQGVARLYVRLAFANTLPNVDTTGDYTKAAVLDLLTGSWTPPLPGPA